MELFDKFFVSGDGLLINFLLMRVEFVDKFFNSEDEKFYRIFAPRTEF